MLDTIIKRDGRQMPFDQDKITDAIMKAFSATGNLNAKQTARELTSQVVAVIEDGGSSGLPTVEGVQDAVERVLIENGFVRTAKSYILYRAERSRAREMNTRLMQIYEDITFSAAIDSDIKRENANINGDTAMGAMLKYGAEGAKQFNQMFVLKPEHARAHQEGDIHIHDMDFLTLTTTCCQIDLIKLFSGGFSTGHGVLREPNDIASYSALACIAIQANQNDQHGGQSVVNFDYAMAEGVKKTFSKRYRDNMARALELVCGDPDAESFAKDCAAELKARALSPTLTQNEPYLEAEAALLAEKGVEDVQRVQAFAHKKAVQETERATYQAMEALVHNLNTMNSRAGAQVPFSSINYGLDVSPEGRLAMRELLLATESGLGGGETPIFPIQIFRVKEGISFNPGDPNYDLFQLACRVSAKRLFPNFSFQDAPFNLPYYVPGRPETEIAYMGCRTRVIGNVHDPEQQISNGRGNLSFTSINLPRIAIRANHSVEWFFAELDRQLDLVIEQLNERFEIQARKRVLNFPFLMGQGVWLDSEKLSWNDEVREVLKHGTLSVGFIGLAETLVALVGEHHGQSRQAQNLGLEIIGHMRARLDEESRKAQMNYTLIATPAEGLSGRFVRIDRKRFGSIPGVTDRDYYTNSFHVPVYFAIKAVDKIRIEAPYHALTNAGHISYVELDGDASQNLEAFEKIVRVMKEAGIGYGSINHPVDRDPLCGFNGVIGDCCPHCGRSEDEHKFERIRRITGYLVGTTDRFNNAKRHEEQERVKHQL
ncbi:MAG: anaerobic ribonucleoside triphosphate reductase [Eubacteriales bacterium]|nr:anaerobic ribonucleoside triphosphate reductase [Christensenellaceae bacterium]MEA5065249.1 anaerobic ribonucleoside triphosphate reductase [Eubacteriales bacterium]